MERNLGDVTRLLPTTRGRAMCNKARNSPSSADSSAIGLVHPNAAAAWVHFRGSRECNFAWSPCLGPRATLVYVLDGPSFFARQWVRLFVHEVVARSRLFAALSAEVLERIARWK